jgi:hypothetical protein
MKYEMNVPDWERVARVALGVGLLSLIVVGPHTWWGLVGLIPLLTGLAGWCPIYYVLGINRRR